MKLKSFLRECANLRLEVDKRISGLGLSDERLDEMGVDLDLGVFDKKIRARMADRKLETLGVLADIDKAIKQLRKDGKRVDFSPVAAEAGVSYPTVKKYFGEEITRLKGLPSKAGSATASPLKKERQEGASNSSKDNLITALRKKKKELEDTNKELNKENGVLLSKVTELTELNSRLTRRVEHLGEDSDNG